jgi:hypothetical protein
MPALSTYSQSHTPWEDWGVREIDADMARSVQAEHGGECIVERPDLFDRDVTDSLAQALYVDRSELFDENPSDSASNLDLRSE